MIEGSIGILSHSLIQYLAGFVKTVKTDKRFDYISLGSSIVWAETHSFAGLFECFFVLTGQTVID